MTSTIEISYYPLRDDYPDYVLLFLEKIRSIEGIEIHTNGMSTILIGEFDRMWVSLGALMMDEFDSAASLFVMKVAPGRREFA